MKIIKQFQKRSCHESVLSKVSFHKKELEPIFKIYGQMVSKGEWRDYNISSSFSNAIFSIFRRSSEKPLYMIIKKPKLSINSITYSIVAFDGQIIKQGQDLKLVLHILNKHLFKVI